MRRIIVIVISAIVSICILCIGAYFIYDRIFSLTSVYVASHNLSQRSLIKEDDLLEIKIPKLYVREDFYDNKDDIVGKYVKLSYSIPKGSYIYKSAIEDDFVDIAYSLLNKDEVSYDIYCNEVKINPGSLAKNMNLDIYLTIKNKEEVVSDLLISNLRIIGFYDIEGNLIKDYDKGTRVHIVEVAVNKDDVPLLNKAMVLGDIRVVVTSDTYYNNSGTLVNENSKLFTYINEKDD
ncbi:MAG: hypothetical protein KBT35_01860 [Firmicutes bacterium]|nr:hypothetical protein [Candidatus Colivicinus equi]